MGCRAWRIGERHSEPPTSGCSVRWSARFPAEGSTSIHPSACWRSRVPAGSASPAWKATAQADATSHRSSCCGRARSPTIAQRSTCSDDAAALSLRIVVTLTPSGVATFETSLTNAGDTDYLLDALRLSLPVPEQAHELLTVGGRWTNEFGQNRTPWIANCLTIENRRGKTSHERLGVVFAGTPAFGEHSGEVWGCHIGWSGNFEISCDAVTDGRRSIQVGELLASGEIVLSARRAIRRADGLRGLLGRGLNAVSNCFHSYLRARSVHPSRPRPVLLNIWEAVYFDHDSTTSADLADIAASVGVERFVVDDGWFHGRRNDRAGPR